MKIQMRLISGSAFFGHFDAASQQTPAGTMLMYGGKHMQSKLPQSHHWYH